jgi:crotonobetainyl-CoA:carnitine CoA-transferase CaiB-like acyl-CoA transferase
VDDIADALRDVLLTEEVTETTPFWAVLAMGLTGRLAADFGARVVRVCGGADPLSASPADAGSAARHAHLQALQAYLCHGKEYAPGGEPLAARGSSPPRIHVRLTYDGDTSLAGSIAGDLAIKTVVFAEDVSGQDGRRAPASEFTIAARSGLLDIVGRSDARPLMLGGHQISYSTGLSGFLAAVALLHGEDIDRAEVSALGTALWINWKSLAAAARGRPIPRRSAESGKWRTAPCADGHVALVYFDRDWPVLGKMTGDTAMQALAAERAWTDRDKLAELERRLEAWALNHTRTEIAAASKSFGLAIGAVWTPAELLADPQYRARDFFVPSTDKTCNHVRPRLPVIAAAQGISGRSPQRIGVVQGAGPLAGVRVIDLGILTAGASTSAILADLGADVIKVESPTYLDPFRGTPGTSRAEGWWNNSDAFKSTNRNKRGICLDLKSARGQEIFLKLAGQSDVVIENFRRGVMQRLGLGYDALRAANGGIILASVSSQGESGPDAGNISFGSTLEATSGLAALMAYDDGVPLVTGMDLNYPDQVGSVFAAAAIVAALHAATRSGTGAHLDISQRELTTYLLGDEIMAQGDGRAGRLGNASPEYLLQDAFAARDGWVAVSIKDEQDLARALTLADPHMAGANSRDIAAFRSALGAWMSGNTAREVCHLLNESGIAAAAVFSGQEAWNDVRQAGQGAIRPLAYSPAGDIVKGFPLHLPQKPIAVNLAAPDLGQHTEVVLRDILGLAPDEIVQLAQDNVIGTRPASPNASRLD